MEYRTEDVEDRTDFDRDIDRSTERYERRVEDNRYPERPSETVQIIREVVPAVATIVGAVKDVFKEGSIKLIEKTRKKYTKHAILSIILFLVLLFFFYAWYRCISEWLAYGFLPNNITYQNALSKTAMAAIMTVVLIIFVVIIYHMLK